MADSKTRSRSRSRERDDPYSYDGNQSAASPAPAAAPVQLPGATPALVLPGMMGMGGAAPLLAAQQAAQDKIHRELFVGNTPPGTSEMLLMTFLNGAMRRVNLCGQNDTPIINCRVNTKFAFVECTSIELANRCLNLNGIPFLGAVLKVSRPSKYAGPHVPSKTWQELTGTTLPGHMPGEIGPDEKVSRELFVGNTTPEMTEFMIRDFLGKAMEQVGLAIAPGNPITACRVSGKFAFIELRSAKEAANALNLNNIPFMGAQLRVGRPSKYTGPTTTHGNWEDILAKYISGEIKLPNQGGEAPVPAPANPADAPSRVVELQNMLSQQDLENDEEYKEILEDTKDECSQFGHLKNIVIPRSGPGATKIFLEYLTNEDAGKAIEGLQGRTFDGRKVQATFMDADKFAKEDYS